MAPDAGSPPRSDAARWFLHKPSESAVARLFVLPYSGCGASMYRLWPRHIGPAEVCALQLPARENRLREPHYGSYGALADMMIAGLGPYLDRPFAFFGHCGAALPGFETALRLARRGLPAPVRLFVSSQVAPHDGPYGRFLQMNDEELAVELEGLIRALGGTPHPALIDLSLDVLRDDVAANKAYRYPEPVRVPCPITAIGWTADEEVPPALMGGWRQCSDDVRSTVLEGVHYSFLAAPEELCSEIARDLELALASPAQPS